MPLYPEIEKLCTVLAALPEGGSYGQSRLIAMAATAWGSNADCISEREVRPLDCDDLRCHLRRLARAGIAERVLVMGTLSFLASVLHEAADPKTGVRSSMGKLLLDLESEGLLPAAQRVPPVSNQELSGLIASTRNTLEQVPHRSPAETALTALRMAIAEHFESSATRHLLATT